MPNGAKFLPKKTRNRDGVYERDGRPGYWISFVDEYGKRRQQYGGPTTTQAREKREAIRTRVRERKEAIANGEPLPTDETFASVAKRYIAFQKKRCAAGELSEKEMQRQEGIVEKHLVPFFVRQRSKASARQKFRHISRAEQE